MKLKLTQVSLQNMKGVEDETLRFSPDSKIVCILGPNGRGKTTFLQAIELLYGAGSVSHIPKMIREGEYEASIKHTLEDEAGNTWSVMLSIEQGAKKETVKVKIIAPDGSTSRDLGALVEQNMKPVDLMTMLRNQGSAAGRRKNVAALENLLGIDLASLEKAVKDVEAARREKSSALREAKAVFHDNLGFSAADVFASENMIAPDTSAIEARIAEGIRTNERYNGLEAKVQEANTRVDLAQAELGEAHAELRRIKELVEKKEAALASRKVEQSTALLEAETLQPVDLTELQQELGYAREQLQKRSILQSYLPQAKALDAASKEKAAADAKVEQARTELASVIARAASDSVLPRNLTIRLDESDNLEIAYVGEDGGILPFHEEQVQQSHFVVAAAELAARVARDRSLPVVTIRDASLMTRSTIVELVKALESFDGQVFMEVPEDGDNVIAITYDRFIEEQKAAADAIKKLRKEQED